VLTAYALAMATNLLRGRVDIDCGCTPGRKQLLSWSLVVRNMILAASSLALLVPVSARTMVLADVLVAVLVAGFTAVMWTLVPMVRRNSLSLVKGVRQ
jgi:hypothetical protein